MRSLLFVVVGVAAGWVARGATGSAPAVPVVAAAPTPPPKLVYVSSPLATPAAVPAPEPEADDADDPGDGVELGELLEQARATAQLQAPKGGVVGRVTDWRTAEPLAGVTVIAESPAIPQAQVAISDEHGDYKIAGLPPGNYRVMFYFADDTVERTGVSVTSFDPTPLDQRIGEPTAADRSQPIVVTTDDGDGISFSGGSYLENEYVY